MSIAKVDVLIWVFLYAGLFVLGLGLAVHGRDAALGWGLGVVGALGAAVGALLVWVRSRMKER